MKKATSAALALHSAIAGLGLLSPLSLFAQTTVTYADTQVSTTNRSTTPANPLTVTLASGVATESGVISGDGSLAKTGAGTLKLGATNTYTGGTFLSAGTLELSADNALGTGAITVTGGGIRAGGAPRTLWNALFTSGSLTVGRLTTFAGTTTLNAATTIIASNPDGLANGDTTFGGVIGGNFGVTLAEGAGAAGIGSGYLVFSGANTYTGGTTLRTRLSINSDAALGATSGALTMDGGTLRQTTSIGSARDLVLGAGGGTFEVTGFSSFGGAVSGSGGITQAGGFLGLSGPLTYTGSTRITNGGVLKFGNSGAGFSTLHTSGVTIESGGLYFGDDVLYAGPISGAGHLKHEFAGTTVLTGTVAHTGGTQINGGAIQIGDGGNTGSLSGDVALSNAGNLAFKRSDAVTFAGVVSGAGTVSQLGTGTLTLTGANTYTGGTVIAAGQVTLGNAGALGTGAVGVASGALLDASGHGFDLNRLSGLGRITTSGAYTASAAGDVTLATKLEGTAALTKTGSGTFKLSGTNTYSGGTTITGGLVNFATGANLGTGNITINGGGLRWELGNNQNISARLNPLGAAGATFDTGGNNVTFTYALSGTGALTKSGSGTATLWGDNTYAGGTTISGGTLQVGVSGTTGSIIGDIANNAALVFDRSDALTHSGLISGSGSVTKSGAGTLSLTGANTYAGGTTITRGTLQLGNGGTTGSLVGDVAIGSGAFLAFNRSDAFTFGGTASGAGSLVKTGAGTLTLTGTNTYSGGTTITGGLVNFATSANLGTGKITLNGGGLQWATGVTTDLSSRLNALGAAGATFDTHGNHVTFASVLPGTGALTKAGAGTLTLTAANTFSGGTTISGCTLQIGNGGTTGSLVGNIANNGFLVFDRSDALTHSGLISGSGSVTKSGAGTLTLTGANTYTGGTTLDGGALQIGNGGTTGALVGDVALSNGGALAFKRSDAVTFAGVISGGGGLTQLGAGTLTLTGTNTYSGGTTVNAGLVNFTSLANFGTGNLTLDGGGLQWAPGQAIDVSSLLNAFGAAGATFHTNLNVVTLASVLTGSGALTKSGYGTLTLTNANTYGGGTVISDGQLVMGNAEALGTGPVNLRTLSTTLDASGYGFDLNRLSGPGTLTSSGAYTASPTSDVTLATNLTGTASLEKTGAATLTLSGTISHTGGTTISGGTLKIGDGGNTASITGNILNHAALVFDLSDAPPYSGVISGPGSVTKSGTGTLSLTGANTYAGGTTITRGTLRIGTGGTTGSLVGDVNISAGATLAFNRSDALTFGGAVSGAGTLVKTGAGTLTLTGASTYSGGTTLTAGVVNFADDANLGTGKITFSGGGLQWAAGNQTDISSRIDAGGSGAARLDTNGNNVTFASVLSGARTYIKSGTGILALTATNTYSGGTTITGGLINFATAANFGTARTTLNGGGLQWATGSTFDISARLNALGAAGATFDTNGNHVTLASILSGTGALNKSGAGTLTLSGANTYAGGTTLNAGTLTAGHVSAFGTGSIRVNAGTLNLGGFAVSNALDVRGGSFTGLANYSGTQTVSGSANYSGAVGGTLLVASGGGVNTTGATFTGPATVQSGGTLTGTGTLASLTVQSGGTLAPGNSPGLLTVNGNLTLDSGSFTVFEIAGLARGTDYDAINVSGALTAGGTLSVSFTNGFVPTASATFDFFNFSSFGGSFAQVNLPVVADYTWNTSQLSIDGTVSLIASAIPEPGTAATLSGLGALAATCIRRRRR